MGQEIEKCTCLRKGIIDDVITADLNNNNLSTLKEGNHVTFADQKKTKPRVSKLKIFQGLINFNFMNNNSNNKKPEVTIQKIYKGYLYRKNFPELKSRMIQEEEIYISSLKKEYISTIIQSSLKLYKDKTKDEKIQKFYTENDNDIEKFKTADKPQNLKLYSTKLLRKIYDGCPSIYIGQTDISYEQYGEGTLYTTLGVMYKGTWVRGEFTGWGQYVDQEGNCFEGMFSNGVLNGKGIKISQNGALYIGQFSNFHKDGIGREETEEHIYEGQYQNDKKKGQGKLSYKNCKDVYQGEFTDNNITGYGFYIWDNKHTYLGDFVNGKMHGKGLYKWPDGSEYEGEYINNIKEGKGSFKWEDGRTFKGSFKKGRPHGVGKLTFKGIEIDAEFVNGKLKGDLKEMFIQKQKELMKNKK